jgi:hypothetical protein
VVRSEPYEWKRREEHGLSVPGLLNGREHAVFDVLLDALPARHAEPYGPAVTLHLKGKVEEGAALAFTGDEGSGLPDHVILGREPEGVPARLFLNLGDGSKDVFGDPFVLFTAVFTEYREIAGNGRLAAHGRVEGIDEKLGRLSFVS